MAWNTPGGNDGEKRGDDWLSRLLSPFRGIAGNDGNRGSLRWIGIALVLVLALDSFVLVTEQQRGVVLRFGRFARVMQPGPHLKLPWPLERVIKVNATEVKIFNDSVPVLTRDTNMVTVDLNVQYRIANPELFLFGTRDAEEVLRQAALSTVREQVGRSDLDTVMNSRGELLDQVSKRLQASLDSYRTGLVISGVTLQNARPPEQVKDAFDEAQRASADKQTAINQAQAYAAKVVPEARGEAARLRTVAEGYRTAAIARATGDAQRFDLLVAQYKNAPDVTRKRLWLETVQGVLAKNRVVVGGDGRQLIYVPMPTAPASPATVPPLLPDVLSPAVSATVDGNDVRPGREPRSADREVQR